MDYTKTAEIYDSFVLADFDIKLFLYEAESLLASGGEIVDLMCGTGRIALPLLKAGHKLVCVDKSPQMLAVLRGKLDKEKLQAKSVEQDIRELELTRKFSLAIIPFNSFSELLTPDDHRRALRAIRSHLAQEGRLIIPMHNPYIRLPKLSPEPQQLMERSLPHGDTIKVILRGQLDTTGRIIEGVQTYSRTNSERKLVEQREIDLVYYLFQRKEFESLAADAGYRIQSLMGDYDRSAFDAKTSSYMIWVLEGK